MPVLSWLILVTELTAIASAPAYNSLPPATVAWDRPRQCASTPTQSGPRLATRFQLSPRHPNPQSQSFSQSYGSILPTSLTYIILSTRGYSPRRPAAVMSTMWCDTLVTLLLIFKVPPDTHGHCKTCSAICPLQPRPILSAKVLQGLGGLSREDHSTQSAGGRLRIISRYRDAT